MRINEARVPRGARAGGGHAGTSALVKKRFRALTKGGPTIYHERASFCDKSVRARALRRTHSNRTNLVSRLREVRDLRGREGGGEEGKKARGQRE